jgi:hypothetical protein
MPRAMIIESRGGECHIVRVLLVTPPRDISALTTQVHLIKFALLLPVYSSTGRDSEGHQPDMAHDVFISYASEDKTVADAVCAMIESQGVRCWIAPRDVLPGVAYGEAIIDAIHGSRIMVLIFSSKANASTHIPKEIERAASRGVAVLPFRIEAVSPGKSLDYFIGSVHWLDAFTPPLDGHVKRLAENVKTLLSRGAIPAEAIPPAPIPTPVTTTSTVVPAQPVQQAPPPVVLPPSPGPAASTVGLYLALAVMGLLVVALCFWFLVRPRLHPTSTTVTTTPGSTSVPPATNPSGSDGSQPAKTPNGETSSNPNSASSGAQLYNQGISSYKNQDFPAAAKSWQQACDAGEAKGCFGVGVMYEDGKGVTKDAKRAVDLYSRACDQSYSTACYNLGLMYGNARGVPADLKRAADLYRRACDGGNAASCNNLAIQYANGQGVPRDDKKAADLYKRSCDAGDKAGCRNLARMLGK